MDVLIKTNDYSVVAIGIQYTTQECIRCFCFKLIAVRDGGTGVYDDPDSERQVCLTLKIRDLVDRMTIVQNPKVRFIEVFDKMPEPIRNCQNDADFLDFFTDRRCWSSHCAGSGGKCVGLRAAL